MNGMGGGTNCDEQAAAYVWCCSVCGDPNYVREGGCTFYLDERFCPTCEKRQPIIVCNAGDPFVKEAA